MVTETEFKERVQMLRILITNASLDEITQLITKRRLDQDENIIVGTKFTLAQITLMYIGVRCSINVIKDPKHFLTDEGYELMKLNLMLEQIIKEYGK